MKVLVGIPTLNGPDRLRRALASIRWNTPGDTQILVSDDASSDENLKLNKDVVTQHKLDTGVEVPLLTTSERLGIPKQWNRLVRHVPEADVIALINDDIEVVPDWLDVLVFTLEKNPQVGMVGLRSEVGVTTLNAKSRITVDYNEARLSDGSGTLLSSGGACFAFRRRDWEAVGGFDERYVCFYEELDFGVSLGKQGFFSVIASYPLIYHMGGATISTNHDAGGLIRDSRRKFTEKWQTTLDQLRLEFGQRGGRLPYIEWNSQWKNWRLP